MKYSVKQGRKLINWNKRLNQLEKDIKKLTKSKFLRKSERLQKLAGEWVTCACGNQCDVIPRYSKDLANHFKGEPKDSALSDLGLKFHVDIEEINIRVYNDESAKQVKKAIKEAKETLNKIELRSAILIIKESNKSFKAWSKNI
tara:strand:+ start:78730 stop:79161 length:432 start_codon:yes stop_codon:yes gene_type:complete